MKTGTLIFIVIAALLVWAYFVYCKKQYKNDIVENINAGITAKPPVAGPKPNFQNSDTILVEQEDMSSGTVISTLPGTYESISALPVQPATTFLRVIK